MYACSQPNCNTHYLQRAFTKNAHMHISDKAPDRAISCLVREQFVNRCFSPCRCYAGDSTSTLCTPSVGAFIMGYYQARHCSYATSWRAVSPPEILGGQPYLKSVLQMSASSCASRAPPTRFCDAVPSSLGGGPADAVDLIKLDLLAQITPER